MKKLMMIAGPNGAGKTTTTEAILSQQEDLYEDFILLTARKPGHLWLGGIAAP